MWENSVNVTDAHAHKAGRQYCSLLVRHAQGRGRGFTLDAKNLLTPTNTAVTVTVEETIIPPKVYSVHLQAALSRKVHLGLSSAQ